MDSTGRGAALALAAAGAVAATAFSAVFESWSFLPAVVAAAVLPHMIGALGRRRGLSPALVIMLVFMGLGLLAVWATVPDSTAWGVPTPGTLSALSDVWSEGWDVVHNEMVPVAVDPGVVLLVVVAVGLLATAAEVLAFSAGSTVGALLPGVVILVIAGVVGDESGGVLPAVGFCLAGACFVALRHATLRSESRTWFAPRRHPVRWSLSRGLLFGSLAVITAVAVAPLLPGADAEALFDYRGILDGDGANLTADNPVVDIRSNLLDFPDTVMFTSDRDAAYYRLTTLDSFDGSTWTFSEQQFADGGQPEAGFEMTGAVPSVEEDFDIRIEALRTSWLPAPYRPIAVDGLAYGTAPDRPDLFVEDGVERGDGYVVRSSVYTQLDSGSLDLITPRTDELSQYQELPDDFPARLRQRAEAIVSDAGAVTPYQRASALRAWFREISGPERFVYDQEVEAGVGVDSIEQFVLQPVEDGGHTGYCEQFATSFAALGRAVGLPTRVVVGYLGGTKSETTGLYEIRGERAHAWSEVYLNGVGWIPFDATPGNGAGERASGDHAVTPIGAANPAPPEPGPAQPPETGPGATQPDPSAPAPTTPPTPGPGSDTAGGASSSSGTALTVAIGVALAVVGILGFLALGAWSIVVAKRRLRRRRSRRVDARGRVVGAWEEAGDRLLEAGIRPAAHDSATEFARRVAGEAGDAAPPFEHLAQRYTEACYSPTLPDEGSIDAAWRASDAVAEALRSGLSVTERVRRTVSLRALRRGSAHDTPTADSRSTVGPRS